MKITKLVYSNGTPFTVRTLKEVVNNTAIVHRELREFLGDGVYEEFIVCCKVAHKNPRFMELIEKPRLVNGGAKVIPAGSLLLSSFSWHLMTRHRSKWVGWSGLHDTWRRIAPDCMILS